MLSHRDVHGAGESLRSRFVLFFSHVKCYHEWRVVYRGVTVKLLVRVFLTSIHLGIPPQVYIYISRYILYPKVVDAVRRSPILLVSGYRPIISQ